MLAAVRVVLNSSEGGCACARSVGIRFSTGSHADIRHLIQLTNVGKCMRESRNHNYATVSGLDMVYISMWPSVRCQLSPAPNSLSLIGCAILGEDKEVH